MVEEVKWQREVLAKAAGRIRVRLASMAFERWHDVIMEQVNERMEALRRIGNRLMNRTITLAFDAWVGLVEQRAGLKRMVLRMLNALTSQCFEAWILYVEEQQRILKRAVYAIGPGRLLFMAFSTWAVTVRDAVAERDRDTLLEAVMSQVRRCTSAYAHKHTSTLPDPAMRHSL